MRYLLYSSAAALLTLAGCQKSDPEPAAILNQDWFNTFEPGSKGYTIFANTRQNQPRRYYGFRLNADGTYLEYDLGPVDVPVERPGTWRREGNLKYRITFTDPDRSGYLLRISNAQDKQLQARRDY
ncbi:hypothetical protein CDA63_06865 [Hymenobacter amundsenii]|uniref:Lipoprotein n=1 Tax=Hymenobacter amundsenii TaxID=2006685 RepID=A0A246FMG4_9BACT|nr:hypothetical protein [Hymenobacter amundsenii]OWP63928.1 hypothetical protein CDA63_06865 [Hymenobacter amundsenii]